MLILSIKSSRYDDAGRLTSFSRLTRMCSGLSDMMNSQVVSADGASLPLSGAYWIFLMANRTELLQKHVRSTLCEEHSRPHEHDYHNVHVYNIYMLIVAFSRLDRSNIVYILKKSSVDICYIVYCITCTTVCMQIKMDILICVTLESEVAEVYL